MNDQKNVLLAIVLSAIVLIGWQYFIGVPQMEKQRQEAQQKAAQTQTQPAPGTPAPTPGTATQVPGQVAVPTPAAPVTRAGAIAASARIPI
jgi:YidC/Oxa1 family membrane protein insertase